MAVDTFDEKRRALLIKATALMGAAGAVATAVPFVASMLPSKDTEAAGAPVRVDLSGLKPGEQRTVEWRGRPVWIIHRTAEMLADLPRLEGALRDPRSEMEQQPAYARNPVRSIKPEFLVVVGICTHLGCVPTYRPDKDGIEPGWPGGFFCSCHGSKFDLAGRVYKGVPAPANLEIPAYAFINDHEILIGVNPSA